MKIRLTQPGYEALTGMLGNLSFTGGLSDLDVSAETVAGIANILQCDTVDGAAATLADDTDPAQQVDNTAGDADQATTAAPLQAEQTDIEPVQAAADVTETDPV